MDEGFPIPGWDVEKHLAFMDRAGIETSVLTTPTALPIKATSKRHTSKNTKKAPPRWCAA